MFTNGQPLDTLPHKIYSIQCTWLRVELAAVTELVAAWAELAPNPAAAPLTK